MVTFLVYMIKISLGLILLYLFFKVLLSRETFFRLNRFVLLGGIGVCLVLPAVRLSLSGEQLYIQQQFIRFENALTMDDQKRGMEEDEMEKGNQSLITFPLEQTSGLGLKILIGGYLLGGILIFLVYGVSFYRMMKLIRQGQKLHYKQYKLILVNQPITPFSFGHFIVMSGKDYQEYPEEILTHEYMHVKSYHTLDLLFIKLLLIVQWFNPIIWLLQKELQEIHEYEADHGVINNGIDATKYQLLLVKKAVGVRLYSLANSFNHSKLKNRITMMLKEKSNHWARLKVGLLIPPAIFTMFAFARPESALSTLSPLQSFKITQIPDDPETWSKEFFESEYQKNALRLNLPLNYDRMPQKLPVILLNRNGQIALNSTLIDFVKLKEKVIKRLTTQIGKQPVIFFVQKDKQAPEEAVHELLKTFGTSYQEVRQKISSQHADQPSEYIDRQCPIMVYFVKDRNFISEKKPVPPPPPSPVITLTLNGEGVKEKYLFAYNVEQLNNKLDQIKELKQYSVAHLKVEKQQMDALKEPILNSLRQRGVLKVNTQVMK